MWEETSQECESGCQCSGLITDAFRINSGNNSTKRKHNEAAILNFKSKMLPHSINFTQNSPTPSKRRILGEIQNQVLVSPMEYKYNKQAGNTNTTVTSLSPQFSPKEDNDNATCLLNSPELNSPFIKSNLKKSGRKIRRIFEDRNRYRQSVWTGGDDATDMTYDSVAELPGITHEPLVDDVSEQYQLISTHKDVDHCIDIETTMTLSSSGFEFGAPLSESEQSTSFNLQPIPHDFNSPTSKQLKITHDFNSPTSKQLKLTHDFNSPTSKQLKSNVEGLHDIEQSFTFISPIDENESKLLKFDSPELNKKFSFQRQSSVNDYIFMSPIDIGQFGTKKPGTNKKDEKLKKSLEKENLPAKKSLKFFEDNIGAKKSLTFSETPTKSKLKSELSFDSTGSNSITSQSPVSTKLQSFNSENTTTSLESGFLDEPFLAIEESNSPKVADFGKLLSGPIKNDVSDFKMKRPTFSRSLSYNPTKNRNTLSFVDNESPSFRKRSLAERTETSKRPKLLRSSSETDAAVMQALNRAACSSSLIGDFSRSHSLPLEPSTSPLVYVSPHTVAGLLRGDYRHLIPTYQIVDCRYPYEYTGGHIQGAVNRHTPDQIESILDEVQDRGHTVLVMHCEYSIQRGPNMYRHLRSADRRRHSEVYPRLSCPEIYLLRGGYRDFYRLYPDLVYPRNYTPMAQDSPT